MIRKLILSIFIFTLGCSTFSTNEDSMKTVAHVDIQKFMGNWYVLSGRFTMLEKEVHNALEVYTWNEKEERIDIGFTYNKGSLTGDIKSIPQKGWIQNKTSNAYWKVSPLWPLKFDYLIVALADDYSWTAIGVPDQKFLWIMARDTKNPEATINAANEKLTAAGYDIKNQVLVPHQSQ